MTFDKPTAVSMYPNSPDLIIITLDKNVFADPLTEVEINYGQPLVIELPRQMDAAKAAVITSTLSSANNAANTFATANLALNILLGASLKPLWGMINTLQFVVFFTEWKVQMP